LAVDEPVEVEQVPAWTINRRGSSHGKGGLGIYA
jgi:hypothetical protein